MSLRQIDATVTGLARSYATPGRCAFCDFALVRVDELWNKEILLYIASLVSFDGKRWVIKACGI